MRSPVLPPQVFDALRLVGDPRPTAAPMSVEEMAQRSQIGRATRPVLPRNGKFKKGTVAAAAMADADAYLRHVSSVYGASPGRMIARGRDLFVRYGDEISAALLLSALPESYAAEWGAPALIAHGDLVWQLPRRIRQTALFLVGVLTDTGPYVVTTPARRGGRKGGPSVVNDNETPVIDPESTLFQQCVGLREFHAGIRGLLNKDTHTPAAWTSRSAPKSVPLNQEDLLATLLSFSVTALRVLEKFGIVVDHDDREAYLFVWNLVGACLGVGTPTVVAALPPSVTAPTPSVPPDLLASGWLLPATVGRAERLLDEMQARQWIKVQTSINGGQPFPWTDLVPGRTLVTALLDGLVDAMPPSRQAWPAIVMRELVPPQVQSRLGLQRTGMAGIAGRALKGTRGERLRSSALRLMANDVTRHAMQDFLRVDGASPFAIPGLDLSQLTPVRRGSQHDLNVKTP